MLTRLQKFYLLCFTAVFCGLFVTIGVAFYSKYSKVAFPTISLEEVTTKLEQQLQPQPKAQPKEEKHAVKLTVRSGDTLVGILQRAGISSNDAYELLETLKPHYNPKRLFIGQELIVYFDISDELQEKASLNSLLINISPDKQIVVNKGIEGSFQVQEVTIPLTKKMVKKKGVIESSLTVAANKQNIPFNIVSDLIHQYSYDVDFQRDIRSGDSFEVYYEQFYSEEGKKVRDGNIISASLVLKGKPLNIYRFTTADGKSDFYTADGYTVRRPLLRTPVGNARISSRYGYRKHPILGYNKMHKGIDFAAPRGTPIYAAGDGVIRSIGRNGGYGNYIRIRHNGTYSTAYAHISRFKKGMHKGKRVKQGEVIAYVGSTGRSTGPHLHYEIMKHGKQTNPLKVKMMPGKKLKGTDLAQFITFRQELDSLAIASISGQ